MNHRRFSSAARPPAAGLCLIAALALTACQDAPPAASQIQQGAPGQAGGGELSPSGAQAGPARLAVGAGDDVITAWAGGSPIWRSEVLREAAAQDLIEADGVLAIEDPVFQRVLGELIDQRLLAQEARRRGLMEDEETRRRLALAEEQILGNMLLETLVNEATDPEAVRRVYESQLRLIPLGEEVRARHILVETREEAEEIRRLVAEGAEFEELAVAVSQDAATRLQGGDLGFFTREGILPEFAVIAFASPTGEISEPFQSEFGWHVLKVIDRRRQPPPSLEEMRPAITSNLAFDEINALITQLRNEAEIERIFPEPPIPTAEAGVEEGLEGSQDDPQER